jgi:hypothetical protein
MTKTLTVRGGALSALAFVLALSIPLAPAEAQRRDGPRAERQETRGERPQVRAERVAPPQRAERPVRAERGPQGGGFGAEIRRRAERYGEPDARPVGMERSEAPARRVEQVDWRSEGRAERIDRGSERRAETVERRADRVEDRGDRRAERVERGGERWGDGVREAYHESRRDGDWRDGRRDRDWRGDRRDFRREQRNWRHDDWRWNYRGWYGWDSRDFRRWDRRWRSNRDYDWAFYRSANRFHFRPGPYYPPFRWHRYSRVQIGFFLDSLFFQPRFFINDPWAYRLPPVYGPYRWVRYYDDVLLVDVYSGEVVDVIYNFFW